PPLRRAAGGELLVVDRARARDVEAAPARVAQPPREVDLVGVDEEVRIEPAHLLRGAAAHEQRRGLAPVDAARAGAATLHGQRAVQLERAGNRARRTGEAPRARLRRAVGKEQLRAGAGCARL